MCIRDSIKGSALKALEDPNGEWGDKIMELMDTVDEFIPDPQLSLIHIYKSEVKIYEQRVQDWCIRFSDI